MRGGTWLTTWLTGETVAKRRSWGDGSIYQRASDQRWIGAFDIGTAADRKRIVVTAKTRGEVVRKLRDRRKEYEAYGDSGWDRRTTVKQWVETYLDLRSKPPKPLSPKGWKAAAQPLRRWVVPTIGNRLVLDLTPADIRKVDAAQYAATSVRGGSLSESTVANTRRQLMTCLTHARAEGAAIKENVFLVPKPTMAKSDRRPLGLPETLRCLAVAETLPHGLRWALTLLYGARQGEMLGLVERDPIDGHPCVDFDAKVIRLEWQLQQLDYIDPKRKTLGFKVPSGFEAVHLDKRFHLVRPKSAAGFRELPMIEPIEVALRDLLERRPANPWGLVFPTVDGKPVHDQVDREEWYAIQYTASVDDVGVGEYAPPLDLPAVFHPSGKRYFYVHECRNTAATELDEVGASDVVVTSLLGHTSIQTSRRYQQATLAPKRAAIEMIAARMGIEGRPKG